MPTIPTVRTPRLTLRPLLSTDAEVLYKIYQVEGVLQYFPNPAPPPLENVKRFVKSQVTHWDKYNYGNWGIIPHGEEEIIGWVGLQFLPETNEIEVGYLLNRLCWGHGFATESALASLEFGFQHLSLNEIIALVHPDNTASIRVIEKCGMQPVDQKVYFGIDLIRYRIYKSEYQDLILPKRKPISWII